MLFLSDYLYIFCFVEFKIKFRRRRKNLSTPTVSSVPACTSSTPSSHRLRRGASLSKQKVSPHSIHFMHVSSLCVMCRTGNAIFCTPHVGDTCDRTNTPLTITLRRECVNIPTVTPEHTQFIDRSKNNKICNTDVVSNIEISDKKIMK